MLMNHPYDHFIPALQNRSVEVYPVTVRLKFNVPFAIKCAATYHNLSRLAAGAIGAHVRLFRRRHKTEPVEAVLNKLVIRVLASGARNDVGRCDGRPRLRECPIPPSVKQSERRLNSLSRSKISTGQVIRVREHTVNKVQVWISMRCKVHQTDERVSLNFDCCLPKSPPTNLATNNVHLDAACCGRTISYVV